MAGRTRQCLYLFGRTCSLKDSNWRHFFFRIFDLKSLNNIDSGAVIVFHIWSLRVVIDCIRIVSAYHSVFAETQLGVTTKFELREDQVTIVEDSSREGKRGSKFFGT